MEPGDGATICLLACNPMELVTTAHPYQPELDVALSGTLLQALARGEAPDMVRIFRPAPTVAFGQLDRLRPGFDVARDVALTHGRTPVIRQAGGHAAAYDSDSLIVEVFRGHRSAMTGLESRFIELAGLIRRTLAKCGVRLELGELPGEHCPGRYSLHMPDGPKVAGVAQRVLPRASLTSAVVVIGGGDALRTVTAEVYGALQLPLDPSTVGAVGDRHPEVSCELVRRAILETAEAQYPIEQNA